jgi:hypothetical protein
MNVETRKDVFEIRTGEGRLRLYWELLATIEHERELVAM